MNQFRYQFYPFHIKHQYGFVLLPILLILAIIAAIALISTQESLVGAKQAASLKTQEQLRYSAEAGFAITTRELEQDLDCTGYNITPSGSLNDVNYTTALSATSGSPVTLTVTTDQGGSSSQSSRQIKMYQSFETLLNANADAYIYEMDSDTNYGSEQNLHVNGAFLAFRRSLLSFDLSLLSLTGSQVVSSDLELYLVGLPENDTEEIRAYTLGNKWVESEVSWNQRKSGTNWNSAGGEFNATSIASTLVDENAPGLYSWDISSVTKEWLDGITNNYGVILRAFSYNNNNKEFAAKEYTTDTSKRPRLRVGYKCECGSGSTTTTTVFQPEEDNTIGAGSDKSKNFRTREDIKASGDGNSDDHALIRFDLSSIPAGAIINSATLELYFEDSSSSGSTNVHVKRLTQAWKAGKVTWLIYDTGANWATSGGDYDPLVYDSVSVTSGIYGYKSWNVQTLVNQWVSSAYPNDGFLLHADVGFNEATFTSKDSAATNQHPKLTVNYTCPCGVDCSAGSPPPPPPVTCDGNFKDKFTERAYSNNDGSLNWTGNWVETGESTRSISGDIGIFNDISSYQLMVTDDGAKTLAREVDLTGANTVTLKFKYRRDNLLETGDYVAVDMSSDGGENWTELVQFQGAANDSAYTSYSADISSYKSANTQVRFRTPVSGMLGSNRVWFDDVEIKCEP